jgi:hypothetical protein
MSERIRPNSNLETLERWFWEHVDFQMELTGKSEQEILNAVKTPGFTGRGTWERNRSQNCTERIGADG